MMKKIYTVMEEGCVVKPLFRVVVDHDEVVDDPAVSVVNDGIRNKVSIGDFVLEFFPKIVSVKVEDDAIEDFSEEYTISIGAELSDAIKNDLIDRGVDPDVAYSVAQSVEYTDATVQVTVSVRDEDVQIDRISEY